ncbi:MAG: glycosyltransferase family 1 protein, partial [Acidimicrobiales bacterium]
MAPRRRRVAVVTSEPLGEMMAGPAIRAWNLAVALAAEQEVRLVTTETCDLADDRVAPATAGADGLHDLERWCDVLVFQGGLLRVHPFLSETPKVVVADMYDPFHLENFEGTRGQPDRQRHATIAHLTSVINDQLLRADFFLCASERQRDFWLGHLAALGRLNPATYDHDPTFRSLIDVVPFGLPDAPPAAPAQPVLRGVVPGIEAGDQVILSAGGVYDWFDPLTLVRAVDQLRGRLPRARLYFLGLKHPNPHIPTMGMAGALRALAGELGLTGHHVFFNDGWVPYDQRAGFLLEADVGVSTHLDHIEAAFSFRTRVLDYFWAGLPVVLTQGDTLAGLVEAEG